MRIAAWALLALTAGSCTGTPSTDFRVTYLTQETLAARPESQEVEVSSGKPERPHVAIATLQGWDAEQGADGRRLMAQMRKKARELGGDAIVEFQLLQRGDTSFTKIDYAVVGTRSGAINAFGVIVRWKE